MKGDDIAARLVAIGVAVIKIVDALPTTLAGRHIGGQLRRSGTSAGANYEEARGAESRCDFAHEVGIALKELQESRYWLQLIAGTSLVPTDLAADLLREIDALCRILATSKRTAQTNHAAKSR